MNNNLFYKSLASLSTIGILILAVLQVSIFFKKITNPEDQLAKSIEDIKSARTDSLKELKDLSEKKLVNLAINSIKSSRN